MKPVIKSNLDYRRFLNGVGGMYRINWRSKPPVRKKVKKPKGKGQKAASIEKESVADLIIRLSQTTFSSDKDAYGLLFRIFRTCFLDESIGLPKPVHTRMRKISSSAPKEFRSVMIPYEK